VAALGALTGNQAMQMVRAGLEAIYLSGWQVAADANNAGQTYPDQSLYPVSSVPDVVRKHQPHASSAPTRSSTPRASPTVTTGTPRSWPTPRPASAARSTPSS
jgi:isocitrate lyase